MKRLNIASNNASRVNVETLQEIEADRRRPARRGAGLDLARC